MWPKYKYYNLFFNFLYVSCAFCAFLCFRVHYVFGVYYVCGPIKLPEIKLDDNDDDDDDDDYTRSTNTKDWPIASQMSQISCMSGYDLVNRWAQFKRLRKVAFHGWRHHHHHHHQHHHHHHYHHISFAKVTRYGNNHNGTTTGYPNKKLSYCRETARCFVSLNISPMTIPNDIVE